jgi:hypothetical protein
VRDRQATRPCGPLPINAATAVNRALLLSQARPQHFATDAEIRP